MSNSGSLSSFPFGEAKFSVESTLELVKLEYQYLDMTESLARLNALGAEGWQVVLYLQSNNSFLMMRVAPVDDDDDADSNQP